MRAIELYRFVEGANVETQTSGDEEVLYNGEVYAPRPIGRTQVQSKNEISQASIDVSMSLDNPLAQRHLASPVDSVVTLTIFQRNEAGTNVYWKGRLGSVKATNKGITISFESIFTSLRRPGLRARYQKTCRHALYARGCNVNAEDHVVVGSLADVRGQQVTVPGLDAFPNGRFRGGMIRAPDGVVRFITDHVGNVVTLSRPFQTLIDLFNTNGPGTVEVKVYPGCGHNITDCDTIFDNLPNYGGFPWIPQKNPMGGSSII